MNALRQRMFSNWHLMRIVRLVLSIWLLVVTVQSKDVAMGGFALFFLLTTIGGVGCCGPQGCSVPERRHYSQRETSDEN